MTTITHNTITLPMYKGREGYGEFEPITNIDEAERYCNANGHVWMRSITGDARRVKVNGKPKRWKRDRTRIYIPVKYGMYEYAQFDERDIADGRLLRLVNVLDGRPTAQETTR